MAELIVPAAGRHWDEYLVQMHRMSGPNSHEAECLVHTGVRRLSDAIQRATAWVDRWGNGYLPGAQVWLEGKVCVFACGPCEDWALHTKMLAYGGPIAPGRYRMLPDDDAWRLVTRPGETT